MYSMLTEDLARQRAADLRRAASAAREASRTDRRRLRHNSVRRAIGTVLVRVGLALTGSPPQQGR